MSEEEKKVIDYFKVKIKNKLPLYEETYVDGKPYRRNILQLETNFTEEQANKAEILLNLIEKQQTKIEKKDKIIDLMAERLAEDTEWFYSEFDNHTKQDFIEYFTNKVEGDK